MIYAEIFSFQKKALLKGIPENHLPLLCLFNRILVQDSTICILNEKLKNEYPGSGGSASKSSLKIDLIHEVKTGAIVKVSISEGNKPDIKESMEIVKEIKNGDLVLRDLGYSKQDSLAEITEKKGYFVSRCHPKWNIYLDVNDKSSIDLGSHLRHNHRNSNRIETDVYIGDKRKEYRLIAYRVSEKSANERRRKCHRQAISKNNGKTASQARLALCDFVILITNIPLSMVTSEVIGTIYRIRWSIELIFKTWKSLLNLQLNLTGSKKTRIDCFVYTILILALLTMMIYGWMKKEKVEFVENELSFDKLTKWLLSREGYEWLLWQSLPKLEKSLKNDYRGIKKQKRKRKTTLSRVVSCESYGDEFIS